MNVEFQTLFMLCLGGLISVISNILKDYTWQLFGISIILLSICMAIIDTSNTDKK